MPFCRKCGSQVDASEAVFCPSCGTPVVDPDAPQAVPAPAMRPVSPAVVTPQPPSAPVRAGMPLWVWFVVGALVALLLIGGVWFVASRGAESDGSGNGTGGATTEEAEPTGEPSGPGETPVEPTPAQPVVSPYEGMPISTPQKGDATRTALMDAARALTGSTNQFVVWQMYVQGSSAIGDIQEWNGDDNPPGRRWLVTWEQVNGTWTGKYFVPFIDAARVDVDAQNPFVSDGLLASMALMVPVPAPQNAVEAARAAQRSEFEPFDIWVPTRMPEGYSISDSEYQTEMYWVHWASGGNEISMFIGWGDHELGGATDNVYSPANWGPLPGTFDSSKEMGVEALFGGRGPASMVLEGDAPEYLIRAVGMSMVRVNP